MLAVKIVKLAYSAVAAPDTLWWVAGDTDDTQNDITIIFTTISRLLYNQHVWKIRPDNLQAHFSKKKKAEVTWAMGGIATRVFISTPRTLLHFCLRNC